MNALRRERLREYLRENGAATIRELSAEFSEVSLMTIHRDLDALEAEGCVLKMRGGARYIAEAPRSEAAFPIRAVENMAAKEHIAALASEHIREGMSVFIDAGTTGMALARVIPNLPINIFTTAPNVALAVSEKPDTFVNLCGGLLNRRNMSLSGPNSLEYFDKVNLDVAFMVASGFTQRAGFTCGKETEAQVKTRVIAKAQKVVMLMDSSKYGKVLPFTFAEPDDIDVFISNRSFDGDFTTLMHDKSIHFFY